MTTLSIKLKTGNLIENAKFEIHRRDPTLTFTRENGFKKTYTDHDLYLCLAQFRLEFPEIRFHCKGAKINVFPSSMCSQMSNGVVAYELALGVASTFDQIVNIFDFEDNNITHDVREQKNFYHRWLNSFE